MVFPDPEHARYKGIKNGDTLELLKNPTSITVKVGTGDPPDIWSLPKALLTRCSPFFAAALAGHFAESTSNTVLLPDDNPKVFGIFVQWMYTGETQHDREDDDLEKYSDLSVDLWILGDKFGCQGLQDAVMDELLWDHGDRAIAPSTMRAVYEGSPSGSKLRIWAMDQFLYDVATATHNSETVKLWISKVDLIEGFGQDFLRLTLGRGGAKARFPSENEQMYMTSSIYKHGLLS